MAEIWGAVIAGAGALGGAYMSSRAAKDSAKSMANTQAQMITSLGGSSIFGPGGVNASLYENGQGGTFNLGGFQSAFDNLLGIGTQGIQQAQGMTGLPDNIRQALGQLTGASGVPGAPDFGNLADQYGGVKDQALHDMQGGIQGIVSNTLDQLRQQAKPFEQRAFNDLQNNQFATGRLGTSGGGLQTEAFARGLAQADTSRQIQATQLGSDLMNQAFGRFNTTAGLSQGLEQLRFGNAMLTNDTGFQRALQNLGTQVNMAQLPMALQGSQLQLGLQGLAGAQGLSSMGMEQLNAALQMALGQANARIGSGSNVANIASARAGMPTSGDIWGQALTGIGTRLAGNQSVVDRLGGWFGSGPKIQPVPSNTPGDPGFQGPVRPVG